MANTLFRFVGMKHDHATVHFLAHDNDNHARKFAEHYLKDVPLCFSEIGKFINPSTSETGEIYSAVIDCSLTCVKTVYVAAFDKTDFEHQLEVYVSKHYPSGKVISATALGPLLQVPFGSYFGEHDQSIIR